MPAVTRASFIPVSFATLVSACSDAGNDQHAYFVKRGAGYLVEMKGHYKNDDGTKVASLWNDEYMLVQRAVTGVP